MLITTHDEARMALQEAQMDVAGDFGEDAFEAAFGDIVRSVADMCTTEVANELLRTNGIGQ